MVTLSMSYLKKKKLTNYLKEKFTMQTNEPGMYYTQNSVFSALDDLSRSIYQANEAKGFWESHWAAIETAEDTNAAEHMSIGCRIALMHSELSEALEADRKELMDDKLPEYPGLHVELADTLIRILDFCGAYEIPIGEIVDKKLQYNASRPYKHGKKY